MKRALDIVKYIEEADEEDAPSSFSTILPK